MNDSEHLRIGPSPIHGQGVFATRTIEEGELIGTYHGEPTDEDGHFVLWVEEETDDWRGILGTGTLRFLNHASAPNAEFDGDLLTALRRIEPEEEITIHYGEEWGDEPDERVCA